MSRDTIYGSAQDPILPFVFDDAVVRVFDDMLIRSIPFYGEIITRQVQLTGRYYQSDTRIYDLGCSNGNLGVAVCDAMGPKTFNMIAVDSSKPMIDAYAKRLFDHGHGASVTLQCGDIRTVAIRQASVVVLNFTLQFLPPEHRDALMAGIYDGLVPGGLFLFCEKIDHANPDMAHIQQSMYYAFKKEHGYSDLEISQKREALEAVLIPEPLERHVTRMQTCGFETMDVWLKWFNFAAMMAVK